MLNTLIGTVVVLLVAIGLVGNAYLGKRDELTRSKQAYSSLKVTHDGTVDGFKKQATRLEVLNLELGSIQVEKDVAINKLNEYRGREHVVSKKPKAIERLANAATKRMFNDLCTASGGDCGSKTSETDSGNTTDDSVSRNN